MRPSGLKFSFSSASGPFVSRPGEVHALDRIVDVVDGEQPLLRAGEGRDE
ncbi:MAG: hypothetical protein LC774_15715 [Acidobacteria bacterium]|nr:hypothetical protein [Acidobacteriota bacterium]